ncbi:MAG: hypothetical protein RIS47_38, partial [Bacteroidota bacterium]
MNYMLFFRLVGGRSFFNWKLRVSYYTLAILSVLLAGISLWIYNLYVEYRNDSIYSDFMRRQLERTTQMDVRYAMQVINIADSKLEQNIKQLAVERTTTLANIMLLVGNKKIANETKSKITELFKKSIQAINSKNDVSDFFLYDSQGNPLAEAQYALNNNGLATDAMGNNRFIQIQNSLDSDFSGSFINYWPSIKLGVSENRRQLVYVQYIESLKVYIGCGIFVDQKLQELQNEILSRFEKLHFVDGNHLFVNTFNGTGVLKNGHKLTGTRSDTVPLEFLNAQLDALQNEGNHTFNYPTATDSTIVSVEAYMKWNWIVGTN